MTQRRRYGELLAVVLAGASHVLVELTISESIALVWTAGLAFGFAVYLIRRARTPGVLRDWGMRSDNFGRALPVHLAFAALGATGLLTYGAIVDSLAFPATFWLTLALYPIWGIGQQFALQNLLARNLEGLIRSPVHIAIFAAALFGVSHYPRLDLALLTLLAGVGFTLVYRRAPNLWAVGIAHGILGTLAAYIVLREDPGRIILGWVFG